MADTFTPNYNLTKPEVGASRDAWGTKWNGNADTLDAKLKEVADSLAAGLAAIKGVPPGTIIDYAGNGVPAGWLRCDGAAVSRTAYPELFAALAYGGIYSAPDGDRFFLPDVRGLFRRGLDIGRGVDLNRGYNQLQYSQNVSHTHGLTRGGVVIAGYAGVSSANVDTGPYLQIDTIAASGGNEARPINLAFPALIRY